jgi:hypothetical protein
MDSWIHMQNWGLCVELCMDFTACINCTTTNFIGLLCTHIENILNLMDSCTHIDQFYGNSRIQWAHFEYI